MPEKVMGRIRRTDARVAQMDEDKERREAV